MPQVSKTFRVFVSSAFSDLRAERNALQQYVFPRLRDLCRRHGCRFQAIDLRWGVRDEAALDQQTMRICLEEIMRCQRASPRPNFIVLLGDRYGWRPLPTEIPADEFEQIRQTVASDDDIDLLLTWYKRDDNALYRRGGQQEPQALYYLQPRTGNYVHFARWETVELQLRKIFLNALASIQLDNLSTLKFDSSATEQEIIKGAIEVGDASEHVFGFFRRIANLPELLDQLPESREARDYVDVDEFLSFDERAHNKLERLKAALTNALKENVCSYDAKWVQSELTTDHLGTLPPSLDECLRLEEDQPDAVSTLCADVWSRLSRVILREISRLEVVDPLTREITEHEAFGKERAQSFVGRVGLLDRVEQYLNSEPPQALVMSGDSGSGKSALMAKAVEVARELHPQEITVARFIGATPESSDGRALLESICHEIARAYQQPASELPSDYKGLVTAFESHLALASADRPLNIFIDALDQLASGDQARNLLWLPWKLPPHVSIVLSTLPGDCLAVAKSKLSPEQLVQVEEMTVREGEELLDHWLNNAGRRLQDDQRREVIEKFRACPLPLYLKLAFEEAKRWHSYDQATPLAKDIEGMISALFNRLADDANHGKTLVAHSLGLLAAAKNGLSEDELLDVLSRSYSVFKDFLLRAHHKPPERRIPVVIWSRLYFDLEPYLTERRADGTVLLNFYHRQLTTVATEKFLAGRDGIERHRALGRYFSSRPLHQEHDGQKIADRRKLSELPHNQAHGRMWNGLNETLCDLKFLHTKAAEGMIFDTINDFSQAQSIAITEPSAPVEVRQRLEEFSIAFNQEFHSFQQRPQTAAQQIFNNIFVQSGDRGVAGRALESFTSDNNATFESWLRRVNVAPGRSTSRNLSRTIAAHDGAVTALATSPSGKFIASGGTDGRIHVWQQRDGALLASLSGHEDGVTGLAWLKGDEEARLCSAGRDQRIRVWDWRLEHEIANWSAHSDQIRALARLTEHAAPADLVSAGDDRVLRVWSSQTGAEVHTLRGHLDRILCVAAGAGQNIYSGGEDRTLRSWQLSPPGEVRTFRGATDNVRCVAADEAGEFLVAGGDDLLLRIWNLYAGSERAASGHRQRINCAGILKSSKDEPDENSLIVSGSDDETVRTWNSRSAEETATLFGHSGPVNALVTDPNGQWFCSGGEDGSLRFWAARRNLARPQATEHEARITALALASLNGKHDSLVTASDDQTLKVWGRYDGELRSTLRGHSGPVSAVLVPDSDHIVSASGDKTVRVWQQSTGTLLHTLGATFDQSAVTTGMASSDRVGHTGAVTCLADVGDGICASGSRDGTVRLWNYRAGEEVKKLSGARGVIENVLINSAGGWVAAHGSAPQVSVWDLAKSDQPKILNGHKSRVSCAAFADGDQLLTGSLDKTLRLWSLSSGETIRSFASHTDWVTCLAYANGLGLIVSGSRDAQLIIWDINGDERRRLCGHTESIRGVMIEPETRRVISYADDQWLIVWHIDTGEEIAAVHLDSPLTSLILPASGEFAGGTRRGGLALLHLEENETRMNAAAPIESRERAA